MQIELKLTILNSGSHLGEEEDHWYIIPLIVTLGMWLIMANKDYMKLAPGERDIDYAKMGLFCAIATNVSSLIWKGVGFLIYTFFGADYLLFHLIYLFMHAVSETIVISLIILIAYGWSLNYLTGPNMDLAFPVCN